MSYESAGVWRRAQNWLQTAPGEWKTVPGPSLMGSGADRDEIRYTLINGAPVDIEDWYHVVRINNSCTATIIGEKALLTAAHCVEDGGSLSFKVKGVTVRGKATHSPLYKSKDHDIAVAILDKRIVSFRPASIAPIGWLAKGKRIQLLGYGCTQPGGGGGNDGILRMGYSVVTGFDGFDTISKTPNGAALCFGDSGGPAFDPDDKYLIETVNSKGNIRDTNYTTRLDVKETHDFLRKWAADNNTQVCGITAKCDGTQPPPPPPGQEIPFEFSNDQLSIKGTVRVKG